MRLRERRERLRVLRLAQEARNRALRAQGLPTPWEQAQSKSQARRLAVSKGEPQPELTDG